jgi:hypothetical protein
MYIGVKGYILTPIVLTLIIKEGQEVSLECDTIMVVSQFSRNEGLFKILEGVFPERYLIGDAHNEDGPNYIHGAIRDGAMVGLAI